MVQRLTAFFRSVAGKAFQSSQWPTFLRTESVATRRVRKPVVFLTQLGTVMFVIITIASIVTPLGLYEELVAGDEVKMVFRYIKDTSPAGYGTPPRTTFGFTRICGSEIPLPCPGLNTPFSVEDSPNGTTNVNFTKGYDLNVPQHLIELYSSGTKTPGSTISNMFNIDWRTYYTTSNPKFNNGSRYLVGSFRQLQSMLLNDAMESVEGLVVDTKNAQIGLRNHTIPVSFKHGAEWVEDLLFIQPETECVNHNLTIDFRISADSDGFEEPFSTSLGTKIENLVLTDRGGFANTTKTYPYYDRSDTQRNPDLKGRAYKAAFMANFFVMAYFNVTNPNPHAFSYVNSENGKRFPLNPESWNGLHYIDALTTSTLWSDLLGVSYPLSNNTSAEHSRQPNPFNVQSSNFTDIALICNGAGGQDLANISNIAVSCGIMYGAPRRSDGSTSLTLDQGSEWTSPIYSCATAVKATIKTVNFRINGTLGLPSLTVSEINDKKYSREDEMPTWAVEDSGMSLADARPLWGIISPEMRNAPNMSFVQKESLYLPGFAYGEIGSGPFSTSENLPGTSVGSDCLDSIYSMNPQSENGYLREYSGRSNIAMYAKWQQLSSSEKSAGKIVNLIWTDIAASAFVGNKGRMGSKQTGSAESTQMPIRDRARPLVRRIKYKYVYGIPSFIVLALWLAITVSLLIYKFSGKANMATLRSQLNRSSPGRLLTAVLLKEEAALTMKTKLWSSTLGQAKFAFDDAGIVICGEDAAAYHILDDGEAAVEASGGDQLIEGEISASEDPSKVAAEETTSRVKA